MYITFIEENTFTNSYPTDSRRTMVASLGHSLAPVINLCSHVWTHVQNSKLVGSFLPKICISFFGNHSDTPYSQRWVRPSHASLSETQLISPKRDCVCNPPCMRLCIALPFVYNDASREMETYLYGRLTCAPSMGCLSMSRSRSSMAWLSYRGTVVGFG